MNNKPTATAQGLPSGRGHERTDARAGWIFAVVFLLAISGIAIHFVLSGVQRVLEKQASPSDRWPALTATRKAAIAWTNRFPPLQVNPPVDLNTVRAREQAQLESYAWMDRTAGLVRIPITQAMGLLLKKGLPMRHGTNLDTTGPSSWELEQQRAAKEGKAQ